MQNIVSDEVVKSIIQDGLTQVDENLEIDEFESAFDNVSRKLRIHCTVQDKESGEIMNIDKSLG